MVYKMVSSKSVIAKVIADLDLKEEDIRITDIKQWIGDACMNIGSVNQLEHKVVATKVCVAVGCQNFEYAIANFQNGNVERTTTKVVDKNFLVFVFALVKTVSKRCSGWLVDDTKNFQSGNFACVLCCLTLSTCSDFPVCRSCSYADTTSESYMPDNSPATILFTASFPVSKRTDPSVHSPPTTAAASTTIPANIFRLLTLR